MNPDRETRRETPGYDDYSFYHPLQTRWSDNDMLGHLNNVIYNRLFELVVVHFYLENRPEQLHSQTIKPVMAESMVRFRRSLSFPDEIIGALRIERIGSTSVRYELALFKKGEKEAAAHGYMVHVFVDFSNNQASTKIPDELKTLFGQFMKK